jgi:hypothetical protein
MLDFFEILVKIQQLNKAGNREPKFFRRRAFAINMGVSYSFTSILRLSWFLLVIVIIMWSPAIHLTGHSHTADTTLKTVDFRRQQHDHHDIFATSFSDVVLCKKKWRRRQDTVGG